MQKHDQIVITDKKSESFLSYPETFEESIHFNAIIARTTIDLDYAIQILASDVFPRLTLTPPNQLDLKTAAICTITSADMTKFKKATFIIEGHEPILVKIHHKKDEAYLLTGEKNSIRESLRTAISTYTEYILLNQDVRLAGLLCAPQIFPITQLATTKSEEIRQLARITTPEKIDWYLFQINGPDRIEKKPSRRKRNSKKPKAKRRTKSKSNIRHQATQQIESEGNSSSEETHLSSTDYFSIETDEDSSDIVYDMETTTYSKLIKDQLPAKIINLQPSASNSQLIEYLHQVKVSCTSDHGKYFLYPLHGVDKARKALLCEFKSTATDIKSALGDKHTILVTGGAMISVLTGEPSPDLDLLDLTDEPIESVHKKLPATELKKYRHIEYIELTNNHTEIQIVLSGRILNHPIADLQHEINRRDMPINSLYYLPELDVIIDLKGALKDLYKYGKLSLINKNESFVGYATLPLRILRTLSKVRNNLHKTAKLDDLHKEQLTSLIETTKTLRYNDPDKFEQELSKGLSSYYWHEFLKTLIEFSMLQCFDFLSIWIGHLNKQQMKKLSSYHNFLALISKPESKKILEDQLTPEIPRKHFLVALISYPTYKIFRQKKENSLNRNDRKYFKYIRCFIENNLGFFNTKKNWDEAYPHLKKAYNELDDGKFEEINRRINRN